MAHGAEKEPCRHDHIGQIVDEKLSLQATMLW